MICPRCGTQNDDDARFCKNCAFFLSASEKKNVDEKTLEEQQRILSGEQFKYLNSFVYKNEKKPKNKKKLALIISVFVIVAAVIAGVSIYNATKCEHKWVEANCSKPKTCSVCGKTEGKPLGHDWVEATCEKPRTCKRCEEQEGAVLGHKWIKATCEKPETCSRCGKTNGKANGHSFKTWTVLEKPTCEKEGKKEGICSVCGKKKTQSIKKLAHKTGGWKIEKKATLESNGVRYKECSLCKKKINKQVYALSKEERRSALKSQCKTYTYKEIARNPDKYEGKYMKVTGKVVQVQEAESELYYTTYRISVTKDEYGFYDDTVYVTCDNYGEGDRILEDDIVTFYGECKGAKTYETVMGASVTIPWVEAEFIELN